MEAISLLARREAAEQMSSAQTQVLAVLTAHPSFRAAFVITPMCIGHECMSNPFRYEALCPKCSFEAALLKARIDESNSGPTLAPHLLDPSCYPEFLIQVNCAWVRLSPVMFSADTQLHTTLVCPSSGRPCTRFLILPCEI